MSGDVRQLHAIDWVEMKSRGAWSAIVSDHTNEGFDPLITVGEKVDIDGAVYEVLGIEAFVMHLRTQRGPIGLIVHPA